MESRNTPEHRRGEGEEGEGRGWDLSKKTGYRPLVVLTVPVGHQCNGTGPVHSFFQLATITFLIIFSLLLSEMPLYITVYSVFYCSLCILSVYFVFWYLLHVLL